MRILLGLGLSITLGACTSPVIKEESHIENLIEPVFAQTQIIELSELEISKNCTGDFFKYAPYSSISLSDKRLLKGFGDQVPLKLFVKQVTPVGVNVYWDDSVLQKVLIDWSGKRGWLSHLNVTGKIYDIRFIWNESTKNLMVENSEAEKGGLFVAESISKQEFCLPFYGVRNWAAYKDASTYKVISGWLKSMGWELEWEISEDLKFNRPISIKGDVIEATLKSVRSIAEDGQVEPNLQVKVDDIEKRVVIMMVDKEINNNEI
ncbi:MAG: hypothetical protein U9N57_01010 [Pseudomonadota bacterium]|nr:hypothetical protein [Pseudomonadota bacterium]